MRTSALPRPVAAALLSCALFGCAPPAHYNEKASAPPASYYPLAIGDHWTYRFVPGGKTYDADVTERKVIDGGPTYAVAINSEYSYMAVLPGGVYVYAQGQPEHPTDAIVFSPPQLMYKLPFVVGDSWDTPALIDPLNPKSDVIRVYGRVEGFEDVTVPAGVFKQAVKVLLDDPRDSPSEVTELWFAPGVGIVMTRTYTQRSGSMKPRIYQTQLVSYKVKPPS